MFWNVSTCFEMFFLQILKSRFLVRVCVCVALHIMTAASKYYFSFFPNSFILSNSCMCFQTVLFFRTVACVCFRTKIYSDNNDRDDMHKTKQKRLIVWCLMIIETIFNCRNSYFCVNRSYESSFVYWDWENIIRTLF
jgi:hypothetical protein